MDKIETKDNTTIITRLTALWALSESGLGGFMHALKIPFTGFFLGGFAIIIITLIARYATKPFGAIMQATLLVMLVKAGASPHSPPMAYIAVGFQGLCGAVCYMLLRQYRVGAILFGAIALFESAVQKFLVTTLIFGKSVWQALDLFVSSLLKDLSLTPDFSFSYWLIISYTTVYILWGALLGWWAFGLAKSIQLQLTTLLLQYNNLPQNLPHHKQSHKRKKAKFIGLFFVLLFICTTFLFNNIGGKAMYVILRTLAALAILMFVINPIVKWAIAKWLHRKKQTHAQKLATIMDLIPELSNNINPAYELAKQNHKKPLLYKHFVINLIMLSLFKKQ